MATILFSDAVTNPGLVANFDPAVDVLVISDASASQTELAVDAGSVTLSTETGSVTLPIDLKTLTSGSSGSIRFVDGSILLIGDGTIAAIADDLANSLTGDDGDDQLRGLGGNDTLYGGEGADMLYGNTGEDSIWAATPDDGSDTVFAGQGNDTINYASSADDYIGYGNLGTDSIISGAGNDVLYGGQGNDTIAGADGDDTIYGNADNDLIDGGEGSDTIYAGQGNDKIYGGLSGSDANVLYGNLGDDTIFANAAGDTIFGGQGNDTITGSTGDDRMLGNLDNDLFVNNAATGVDTVIGGAGSDTLSQNLGATTKTLFTDFDAATDVISLTGVTALSFALYAYGGAFDVSDERANLLSGEDLILKNNLGEVTLQGGAGKTITGDNLILADNTVFAYNVGGAATALTGDDGADLLVAGDNGDTLIGGDLGNDTFIGGDGADLVQLGTGWGATDDIQGGAGNDTMTATVGTATAINDTLVSIEQLTLAWDGAAGTASIVVSQSTGLAVTATGFTAGQDLYLDAGGVNGTVSIAAGIGDDELYGSSSAIAFDTLSGGDGDDQIYGQGGNDVLNGNEGADIIVGGAGADTLTGGAGADVFLFQSASQSGFTLADVDHITDFVSGSDQITFSGGGAAVLDERLTDLSTSTSLLDAAGDAFAAAGTVNAKDAVLFVFGGRTYAYVDDGDAAFTTGTDLLVDITGFTGTTLVAADFT